MTRILVRLITRDDAEQAAAVDAFVERGAWVSQLVLMETVWVLSSFYGRSRIETIKAVEMLLGHSSLVLQDPDTVAAALDHYRSSQSPEFSDCLILEVARKHGHLPLGTFDRRFSRLLGVQRV